jgi:WD40 repeat protein
MDGTLRIWNTGNGRLDHVIKAGEPLQVMQSTLSPDGKLLAASLNVAEKSEGKGDDTRHLVKLWDTETGEEIHSFDVPEAKPVLLPVMFSPDGRWLALGSFCKIILLDVATGKERHTLIVSPDPVEKLRKENAPVGMVLLGYVVTDMTFSPDGNRLVTAAFSPHALEVWDTHSGQKLNEITADPKDKENPLEAERFGPAFFSADGRSLSVLKNHRSLKDPLGSRLVTYDAATLHEIRSFLPAGSFFAFNRDHGGELLMARRDGEIDVLDLATGKVKRTITLDQFDPAGAVALSSDGKWLAAADTEQDPSSIHLWDLTSGRRTMTIAGLAVGTFDWDEKPHVPAESIASPSRSAKAGAAQPSVKEAGR